MQDGLILIWLHFRGKRCKINFHAVLLSWPLLFFFVFKVHRCVILINIQYPKFSCNVAFGEFSLKQRDFFFFYFYSAHVMNYSFLNTKATLHFCDKLKFFIIISLYIDRFCLLVIILILDFYHLQL